MKCFYFLHGTKKEEKNAVKPVLAHPTLKEHALSPKSDSHSLKSDSYSPNSDSHSPNSDSHSPKSDSHSPKSDSHSPKSYSHSPKSDSHSSNAPCRSAMSAERFSSVVLKKQLKPRVFTFDELKSATNDFDRTLVVGEGGFGCVYRGSIKSSEDPCRNVDVAIKKLSKRGLQGHREWLTEVNFLGVVDHPNLVKLIGYCAEDDERGVQRLLVYEFMSNGSVLNHLSPRSSKPLSWSMRLKIALGAARGLAYLHEEMDFQIIFRDFKTSNILLNEKWIAKLSDFGLAREGPTEGISHVSTAVVGTIGYSAPEYMQTGHLTVKSDIWSYGIVLYELITGRRPMDRNRPKGEQKLLEWVRPYISNMKKFPMIVDPRLGGHFSLKSAQQLAAVANRCLVRDPKSRPKMSEVMDVVRRIVETTETGSPQSPLVNSAAKQEEALENKKQQT